MTNEYQNIFTLEKISEYSNEWIYLPKYIRIYSNIQIFVPHWLEGAVGLKAEVGRRGAVVLKGEVGRRGAAGLNGEVGRRGRLVWKLYSCWGSPVGEGEVHLGTALVVLFSSGTELLIVSKGSRLWHHNLTWAIQSTKDKFQHCFYFHFIPSVVSDMLICLHFQLFSLHRMFWLVKSIRGNIVVSVCAFLFGVECRGMVEGYIPWTEKLKFLYIK